MHAANGDRAFQEVVAPEQDVASDSGGTIARDPSIRNLTVSVEGRADVMATIGRPSDVLRDRSLTAVCDAVVPAPRSIDFR
jgi:hypothetical protein